MACEREGRRFRLDRREVREVSRPSRLWQRLAGPCLSPPDTVFGAWLPPRAQLTPPEHFPGENLGCRLRPRPTPRPLSRAWRHQEARASCVDFAGFSYFWMRSPRWRGDLPALPGSAQTFPIPRTHQALHEYNSIHEYEYEYSIFIST